MIASRPTTSDRVLQTYLPIIPSTSGARTTYKTIGDAKFTAPLVGTGPYTVGRVADRPVRPLRAQPQLLGHAGATRTRSSSSIYKTADTMVQALKAGELDYAHGVNAGPVQGAQERAEHPDRRRRGQRLDAARRSTPTGRHRQDDHGRRRRPPRRSRTRPSGTRSGYAIDKQTLVDKVLGGYGDVGHDDRAAGRSASGTSTRPRRAPSTSTSPSRSSTPPATSSTASGNRLDKQGKPITLRLYMPGLGRRTTRRPPSSSRTGTASSGSRSRPRSSTARPWATSILPPEAGDGYTGQVRHRAVGLVRGRRPERRCSRSSSATRSAARPTASTATRPTTSCTTQQLDATTTDARKAILAQMQNMIYDAGALRHPVLRLQPRRVPDRPVRGLAEPAAGERHAAVHLRHARLHAPDRRDRACPSPTPDAGRSAAAPGEPRRRRRRPRPPATPGSASDNTRRSCVGSWWSSSSSWLIARACAARSAARRRRRGGVSPAAPAAGHGHSRGAPRAPLARA